ncbi:hypothetical protein [Nocardia vinacea]|uniref:hypothetical protein n=1 Tax=Nocardia vinacea TaxID=96468 RepID=UPI0003069C2E|nr:hypothetical protein [Nocardia vinacea]
MHGNGKLSAVVVVALLLALARSVPGHADGSGRADATVRVEPGPAAAVLGSGAVGVDAQFWNENTVKPEVPGLLHAAGVQTPVTVAPHSLTHRTGPRLMRAWDADTASERSPLLKSDRVRVAGLLDDDYQSTL